MNIYAKCVCVCVCVCVHVERDEGVTDEYIRMHTIMYIYI